MLIHEKTITQVNIRSLLKNDTKLRNLPKQSNKQSIKRTNINNNRYIRCFNFSKNAFKFHNYIIMLQANLNTPS